MVEEAMQNHRTTFEEIKMNLIHSGLDEQSAIEKAYANILPKIQGTREYLYGASLMDATAKERSNTSENNANERFLCGLR